CGPVRLPAGARRGGEGRRVCPPRAPPRSPPPPNEPPQTAPQKPKPPADVAQRQSTAFVKRGLWVQIPPSALKASNTFEFLGPDHQILKVVEQRRAGSTGCRGSHGNSNKLPRG